jgi:hypothetical protein
MDCHERIRRRDRANSRSLVDVKITGETLAITLPKVWKAEYSLDYAIIERVIDDNKPKKVRVDLTKVSVFNPATMWLIDQIQWKCNSSRSSFHIDGTGGIV